MIDFYFSGGLFHRGHDLCLRQIGHLQREGDILRDRHMRVERVALEHHSDVAVAGIRRRHVLAVDEDAARRRGVKPGKDAQGRALAGSGRSEQGKKLAGPDLEADALQRGEFAVHPGDVRKAHLATAAHRRPPPLTAPTVNPLTICFCATTPRTTTGNIASTETAASLAHSVCSTETKLNIATVTGRTVLPLSTTANKNSFHALRNTNTTVTAMPPRTCGMMIRHNVRNRLAPSR